MRRCGYWATLLGQSETNDTRSITIRLPRTNVFDVAGLRGLMSRAAMTSTLKLPRDQVEALRPRDLQLYLVSRGWVADPAESSPAATLFRHPGLGDAEVFLPLRRDFGDYTLRMADVVQALALVERRPVFEMLNECSGPPSDVLRLRVSAPDATLGNLPLDEGLRLLRGGRDILLSAACSTVRPLGFHPEKSLKKPNDFIRNCRWARPNAGASSRRSSRRSLPRSVRRACRVWMDSRRYSSRSPGG